MSATEEEEELVLDSSNLIVNYLPSSLTDEGFAQMFERIGPLEAYKLMRNKAGESLAFGFVHYKDPKHGLQAIEAYNGRQREGKTMKVRGIWRMSNEMEDVVFYLLGVFVRRT